MMNRAIILAFTAAAMAAPTLPAHAQNNSALEDFQLKPSAKPDPALQGPDVGAQLPSINDVKPGAPAGPTPAKPAAIPMVQPLPAQRDEKPAPAQTAPAAKPAPAETAKQQAATPGKPEQPSAPASAAQPATETPDAPVDSAALPQSGANSPQSSGDVTAPPPAATAPDTDAPNYNWLIPLLLVALLAGGYWLFGRKRPAKTAPAPQSAVPSAEQQAAAEAAKAPDEAGEEPLVIEEPVAAEDSAVDAAGAEEIVHPTPKPAPPRLSMEFKAQNARWTLVGAAVVYRITIRNDGKGPAENVRIAMMMRNASGAQEQELSAWFSAPLDHAAHQIAELAPGESLELQGEVRIAANELTPLAIGSRPVLIPVVAAKLAHGARAIASIHSAFIVGEEHTPPTERLAPLRMDQGPRQYSNVGTRPAISRAAA